MSPSLDEIKHVLGPSLEVVGLVNDESPLLENNGNVDLKES